MVPADHPTDLRRRCEEEAQQMVQLRNMQRDGHPSATNPGLTHLISSLTALLLQIKVEDSFVVVLSGSHYRLILVLLVWHSLIFLLVRFSVLQMEEI